MNIKQRIKRALKGFTLGNAMNSHHAAVAAAQFQHTNDNLRQVLTGTFILCMFIFCTLTTPLAAAPLDKEKCKALQDELKTLKTHDSVKAMEKGFKWVEENIKGDDLIPIRQYMEINEQLKFLCSNKETYDLPETQVPITIEILLPIKKPEGSDDKHNPQKPVAIEKPVLKQKHKKEQTEGEEKKAEKAVKKSTLTTQFSPHA